MSGAQWLIYGANGYTGQLLAEEAVRRGHRPLLAGRSVDRIQPLADRLGCEARVFGLDDRARWCAACATCRWFCTLPGRLPSPPAPCWMPA